VQAALQLTDIPADIVTRFIPEMARAQGKLLADLKLSGTLGEPCLSGQANWQDGNVIIPDLGITVADIRAQLQSQHSNKIEFLLQARSGEGNIQLTGSTLLDPAQGWPTKISMQSERMEVANIPEALILIDSKVSISMQGSDINIDGDVSVPLARLRPRGLPEGTQGLSRDVVMVDTEENNEFLKWRVTTRVRVTLGELVDFDGFGVNGRLRGSLLLIDEPGKLVLGRGDIRIEEGIYRLKGQDLQIRRGRLIFADTFIDDPGIDVDAIREIDTVKVGVRLKGTLRQPQLTIFSEPTMAESEALSYLILGYLPESGSSTESDSIRKNAAAMGLLAGDILSQEIGARIGLDEMRVDVGDTAEKTALVMGKYLSPRLYVRYFSGLVESSNIVQLRYRISDRVQIQTEGGYRGSQSITGGDIFFTLEY
jgi:translocation and assembly module TamB